MARQEVLGGLSLGTERPFLNKRFANLGTLGADFGGEEKLVGIAYDPRHKHEITEASLLWLAGDSNKKLYVCDSNTMIPVRSFDYPQAPDAGIAPATKCFGLTTIATPTDCDIMFLTEAGLDFTGCPILYHLKYVPGASTMDQLEITGWYYLSINPASNTFALVDGNRGMTEYKGDLMLIAAWQNNTTVNYVSKYGQILATYPDIKTADSPRGLLHMHDRVFSVFDGNSNPEIGSRYLAKFLSDRIDKKDGAYIPLLAIEPFFLNTFQGDLTLYQDNMAACDRDRVYTYKMLYFCFVVDDMFHDDIDMGSVLIGDEKVKLVKLKNIADKYSLKDVQITKGTVICPGGAAECPAKEALDWVKMSVVDPETTVDPSIWNDTIYFATAKPWIHPDGEREFWIKISIPATYTNLTIGGMPRPVSVDDGPFVVPLSISCKVG